MRACDRCRRIATEKTASGHDACAVCFADFAKMVSGFFTGRDVKVATPDIVPTPVPVDDAVTSTVDVG